MIKVWLVLTLGMGGVATAAVTIPVPYETVEACQQAAIESKDRRDYIYYYGFTCVVTPKLVN